MQNTNWMYRDLICRALHGERVETRNHAAFRVIDAPVVTFHATPLVTIKRTAAFKALREMEWFLSGCSQCPPELLDWWGDQLCRDIGGHYYHFGYSHQFRHFGGVVYDRKRDGFDQIASLIDGIKAHPHSRRHIVTTWHPYDAMCITDANSNEKTPAPCHGTVLQFFVQEGQLHMKQYQRSADIVLGVPHNWIQYWGLLLWLSAQTALKPGTLQWVFGDLHLYDEPSHLSVAVAIMTTEALECNAELVYRGHAGDEFKSGDFELTGSIPDPVKTKRANLL